nr:hypothetical protein [Tanacetum cinerariifolium]
MHKAFPLPVIEFPLSEEVSTASEESSHYQKKRDATTEKIALRQKSSSNFQQAQELWAAILKTFGGNEAIKTTKKNLLKQQYGNFKAEGSETLERIFNRLQVIDNHLEFMDIEIEHDDLNQNGSQIKFEDINQIDEDDMEEMDIKWNMALLSMRVYRFWKKTGKNISIQGIDVVGFDKSKVECFNCHKMGHFARECRAPRSQDRGRRDNYRQRSKVEEQTPKALMSIDRVGWDWSYVANYEENHTLVADEEAPTKFSLMAKNSTESEVFDNSLCYKAFEARLAEHRNQEVKYCEKIRFLEFKTESRANCIESLIKELELIKKEKEGLDSKLAGFQTASKDLDNLLESQRLDKNKEGLGYNAVPPPLAQVYSPPNKDLSWTGLSVFADDTVTDYSRPAPTVENSLVDAQNRNPSVTATEASPNTITPKPFIMFVKATDRKFPTGGTKISTANMGKKGKAGSSQNNINDKGYWDSGCSRHMTGNISYLSDYGPFDRGYVSFGQGGCKTTGKETIKTGKLEFENVYFMKDLKTPRQHNMYLIDLKDIVPHKDLTCLVAKSSADEYMIWHKRL